MLYFDACYIARLYLDDAGFAAVRELAATAPIACGLHGRAETAAALHRRLRDGAFTPPQYRSVLEQFESECDQGAFRWLPLSEVVVERLTRVYRALPKSVALRAADALHLACAAENGFREIYSNDRRLLAATAHFSLAGRDVTGACR